MKINNLPPICLLTFKTKKQNYATALAFDLGYTEKIVSFDSAYIAEVLGTTVREYQMRAKQLQKEAEEQKVPRYIDPITK